MRSGIAVAGGCRRCLGHLRGRLGELEAPAAAHCTHGVYGHGAKTRKKSNEEFRFPKKGVGVLALVVVVGGGDRTRRLEQRQINQRGMTGYKRAVNIQPLIYIHTPTSGAAKRGGGRCGCRQWEAERWPDLGCNRQAAALSLMHGVMGGTSLSGRRRGRERGGDGRRETEDKKRRAVPCLAGVAAKWGRARGSRTAYMHHTGIYIYMYIGHVVNKRDCSSVRNTTEHIPRHFSHFIFMSVPRLGCCEKYEAWSRRIVFAPPRHGRRSPQGTRAAPCRQQRTTAVTACPVQP